MVEYTELPKNKGLKDIAGQTETSNVSESVFIYKPTKLSVLSNVNRKFYPGTLFLH